MSKLTTSNIFKDLSEDTELSKVPSTLHEMQEMGPKICLITHKKYNTEYIT